MKSIHPRWRRETILRPFLLAMAMAALAPASPAHAAAPAEHCAVDASPR